MPKAFSPISYFRKQEYSARTLGATWGIISAVMVPIMVVLICIGWRILQRRKAEEKEENDFLTIRPLDPDESVKINSDDDSIPYKKDVTEDSPLPTEPVKVADNLEPEGEGVVGTDQPYTYGQPYDSRQARPYAGETEIN